MRLFVALDLPPGAKDMLVLLQNRLIESGMKGRPSHPDNLHITLQFLGEVPESSAPALVEAVDKALKGQIAPQVYISGVGVFVRTTGDTVFAQLDGDLQAVHGLQQNVVAALKPFGFRTDGRPFTPHITLFRNPNYQNRGIRAKSDAFFMSTVSLYSSKLGAGFDGGPLYLRLREFVLSR
jgi:RNA 2',3'-cyclic 3'-phosphodiesterase